MKLVDLICLSVILTLFSTGFTAFYSQLLKMDLELEEMQKKTDSLIFISESFFNLCEGKGFSSFEEWESVCKKMWKLENIEWECIEEKEAELYVGKWNGPYGSGEVYGKKNHGPEKGEQVKYESE